MFIQRTANLIYQASCSNISPFRFPRSGKLEALIGKLWEMYIEGTPMFTDLLDIPLICAMTNVVTSTQLDWLL